jgi:hypothetical protein
VGRALDHFIEGMLVAGSKYFAQRESLAPPFELYLNK